MEENNIEVPYIIRDASIKDDLCNYSFEVIAGIGQGDTLKANGSNMIHGDMIEAFANLRVHLAFLDDSFKHSGVDAKSIDNIDEYKSHELTQLYHVTGMKFKGNEDNPSVVIIGSKHISMAGGRVDITTPKIPLDGLSSYPFASELYEVIELIRSEVTQYKEGKYSDELIEHEANNPQQTTILDQLTEADFESAKV